METLPTKRSSGSILPTDGKNSTYGGNITINANSVITFAAGAGSVVINGSSPQGINNTGASPIPVIKILTINKPSSNLTLNMPIAISSSLSLILGNIISSSTNSLTFKNGATTTGAGNASFVSGPVIKTGNNSFTFPVGKNAFYAPISITAPGY